jgi:hypothetical protein
MDIDMDQDMYMSMDIIKDLSTASDRDTEALTKGLFWNGKEAQGQYD